MLKQPAKEIERFTKRFCLRFCFILAAPKD